MEFQILKVTDNEDGSFNVDINMDDETRLFLLNYAVVDILRRSLKELEEEIHGSSD